MHENGGIRHDVFRNFCENQFCNMAMEMASNEMFKIEKLTHGNYNSWSFKVKTLLAYQKVWNVIEDNTPDPITEAWKAKSDKALQTIVLSCENNQLVHLKQCKTGRQAWNALKAQHHHPTVG